MALANRFHLPLEKTLRVIHLCFIFVFLLTTFLFWQQGKLFNQGYRTSQLSHLESVVARLESRAKYTMDSLRYLQRIFIDAMDDPLFPGSVRAFSEIIDQQGSAPLWGSELPLPLKAGFSPNIASPAKYELHALRKIQDFFPLAGDAKNLPADIYYISRQGKYIASLSPEINSLLVRSYHPRSKEGIFILASPLLNPQRQPFWTRQNIARAQHTLINSAVPIDFHGEWIGLLGIAITGENITTLLNDSLSGQTQSAYQLFDGRLHPLTAAAGELNHVKLTAAQLALISKKLAASAQGTLRFWHVYVTFGMIPGTQSVLISTQTLRQGLHEDFGHFSALLVMMWVIFVLLLWASHRMICRLVRNMGTLQREMHWHAYHDPLTSARNRRGFFEKTAQLSPRYKDYTLIQIDLDRFKKVNDSFGHQAGDSVLVHATQYIQQAIRSKDVLGRLGGEEFCVYLPDTHLEAGIAVAVRIKKQLEFSPLALSNGSVLTITASLGVAAHSEHPHYSLEQIQSLADERLYRAKLRGRNQVCADGEETQA
ncbi:diguanylate cyclase [Cedecea colo]|uniref:diguanylate cyclase n=1 Tax=Cedecea colo TaxID=2552946 RepID=A0ABX0VPV0_9ENTR|nr:diguanylate cyclase [Cedecea colo]NIY49100.1 diguanylate cyclase [Cedecea colo]